MSELSRSVEPDSRPDRSTYIDTEQGRIHLDEYGTLGETVVVNDENGRPTSTNQKVIIKAQTSDGGEKTYLFGHNMMIDATLTRQSGEGVAKDFKDQPLALTVGQPFEAGGATVTAMLVTDGLLYGGAPDEQRLEFGAPNPFDAIAGELQAMVQPQHDAATGYPGDRLDQLLGR